MRRYVTADWPLKRTLCVLAIVVFAVQWRPRADQIPPGWTADNMTAVGYSDLDGRGGAFKMAIKNVGDKWYLYMGHLWHRGWTIVDVTDPTAPTMVKFIPWPQENTWTLQMEVHGNLMITALERAMGSGWGGDPDKPFDEGVVIWDLSDPVNPTQLAHWKTGSTGTHRNGYPGGRYAYLAANMPGFQGYILVILDISDPRKPREAGRWWLPGQKEGEPPIESGIPGVPNGLHGPAIIDGNRAYLGYGPAVVILDISDVSKPEQIGRLDVSPPFGLGMVAVHDVLLIPGTSLLFANSESVAGDSPASASCDEPALMAALIDIKDPTSPRLVSLLPTPRPADDAPYRSFCDKGGRFGPHNTNLGYHSPDVEPQGNLLYVTYFNAGLRVFDIANPRMPREVAWFIPPTPPKRVGPIPSGRLVTQTEDVLVDRRGYVYITDKQWGLFVLRLTGR